MRPSFLRACSLSAALVVASALGCGGSSTNTGGAGGSNGSGLRTCENATPSEPTGWVRCDSGVVHRETPGTCLTTVDPNGECTAADGSMLLYGHLFFTGGFGDPGTCIPGCISDGDCAAGQICFCEEPVGRCIPADCSVDDDCGPDSLCATYLGPPQPACSFYVAGAACLSSADRCRGEECNCTMVEGRRECREAVGGCGPGR